MFVGYLQNLFNFLYLHISYMDDVIFKQFSTAHINISYISCIA